MIIGVLAVTAEIVNNNTIRIVCSMVAIGYFVYDSRLNSLWETRRRAKSVMIGSHHVCAVLGLICTISLFVVLGDEHALRLGPRFLLLENITVMDHLDIGQSGSTVRAARILTSLVSRLVLTPLLYVESYQSSGNGCIIAMQYVAGVIVAIQPVWIAYLVITTGRLHMTKQTRFIKV